LHRRGVGELGGAGRREGASPRRPRPGAGRRRPRRARPERVERRELHRGSELPVVRDRPAQDHGGAAPQRRQGRGLQLQVRVDLGVEGRRRLVHDSGGEGVDHEVVGDQGSAVRGEVGRPLLVRLRLHAEQRLQPAERDGGEGRVGPVFPSDRDPLFRCLRRDSMHRLLPIVFVALAVGSAPAQAPAAPKRLILAMGGWRTAKEGLPLMRYFIGLTGNPNPKVCLLPTASGDSAESIVSWYDVMNQLDCRPRHLRLFQPSKVDDWEKVLMEMDAIYVGGGNTLNLLSIWREQGIDKVLRKAWEKGIVLG